MIVQLCLRIKSRVRKDRGIYEVGRPFYLKVCFTGEEINSETDSLLCMAMAGGHELLPGLRLDAIYAKFATEDVILLESLTEDLRELRDMHDSLLRKYSGIKSEICERNIDKLKAGEL